MTDVATFELKTHGYLDAGATFCPDRIYRYSLWRRWSSAGGIVLWIMLNPSTADEHVLDPTIRRCEAFSRTWGHGGLVVCNLFALRSTDPKALYAHADPVGPGNDWELVEQAQAAERIVAAWGVHGKLYHRARHVVQLLDAHRLQCLAITKGGHPGHPLYLPGGLTPQPYRPEPC